MYEFEGIILPNFRVKYKNQNGKDVEKTIPGNKYNLQKGQFVNEACVVYVEKDQIIKITLKSTGEELPLKQSSSQATKNPSPEQKSQTQETSTEANTMPKRFFVPKDTNNLIQNKSIENFGLSLKKFIEINDKKDKRKFELNKVPLSNFSDVQIESVAQRKKNSIELMNIYHEVFDLKTDWRLTLGLGEESVYETSMRLHSIYGIPYIPASSIKGVMRNWVIQNIFVENGNTKEAEVKAIKNPVFCDLFGCPEKIKIDNTEYQSYYKQDRVGKILFFDAFPTTTPKLELDIMNPHYTEYYTNQKPPGDYYNPVPINFLVVTETTFQFIIGTKQENKKISEIYKEEDYKKFQPKDESKLNNEEKFSKDMTLLSLAKLWLKLSLIEHGIGAKTSVGYGYFKEA